MADAEQEADREKLHFVAAGSDGTSFVAHTSEYVVLIVPALGLRLRFDPESAWEITRYMRRAARMIQEPPRPGNA